MPKILLIGGSRDGEWIEDPGLPRYHVILQDLKSVYDIIDPNVFSLHRTEVYKRRVFHFTDHQEHTIYALEDLKDYQIFALLLKNYKLSLPAEKWPEPQTEDPDVTKRKAEDKLAAAAWNAFMAQPIPKQK